MKTHNKHPRWMNQPLRLSRKERKKPALVINEFFDHYHLQDIRELLWNWTVEIISSDNNLSYSAQERSNIIFFYEKIESLVEAVYVDRRKKLAKNRRLPPKIVH